MKKLLAFILISGFMFTLTAAELGEQDSRCIYTKCEMDRSDAVDLNKDDSTPRGQKKGKRSSLNM